MLTGQNGILNRASEAKEKTQLAEQSEKNSIESMEELINDGLNGNLIQQVWDTAPGILDKDGNNNYIINSIEDLVFFSYDVRNGNTYEGKNVKLGLSLDFNSEKSYVDAFRTDYGKYGYDGILMTLLTSNEGFIPIGSYETIGGNYFAGTFDGNNKKIINLHMSIVGSENDPKGGALFSINNGLIKNLNIYNPNIITENYVPSAGIAALNKNKIINCKVEKGNIKNTSDTWAPVGGICAVLESEASIEKCGNSANITRINPGEKCDATAGGIAGQSSDGAGYLKDCYNAGKISYKSENANLYAGGIIGYGRSDIENCYNTGKIEVDSNFSQNVGGIAGLILNNEINNSYNAGEIEINGTTKTDENSDIGGITGVSYSNLNSVFNLGKITIKVQKNNRIGGIIGCSYGENIKITNVCNIGNIILDQNLENEKIGSVAGSIEKVNLSNCSFLKGTYSKGIGFLKYEEVSVGGIIECGSMNEIPSIIEVINKTGAFKSDEKNINNGYPILNWQ